MKTKLEENMEDILNLPEVDPMYETETEIVPAKSSEMTQLESDFEQVRNNIHEIIRNGKSSLDDVLSLAKMSDSPRAYEVAAQMIKTLVDANKDLMDLHKKIKEVSDDKNRSTEYNSSTNIENAIFVGSTTELQKLVNSRNKSST